MDISAFVVRRPKPRRRTPALLAYSGTYSPSATKERLEVSIIAYLFDSDDDDDHEVGDDTQYHLVRTKRVVEICHNLSHPNILQFYGTCKFDHPHYSTPLALVFADCSNGNLHTYIPKAGEKVNRISLMAGIAKGLIYLHSRNIVHGDLHPKVVLIEEDGNPVLSEFGRSRRIGRRGQTTQAYGTRRYSSPEAWDVGGTGDLIASTDVYSFGLTSLFVLSGKIPYYQTSDDFSAQCMIQRGISLSQQMYPEIANELWKLIESCWQTQPESRPSIQEVLDLLTPFM